MSLWSQIKDLEEANEALAARAANLHKALGRAVLDKDGALQRCDELERQLHKERAAANGNAKDAARLQGKIREIKALAYNGQIPSAVSADREAMATAINKIGQIVNGV